MNMKKAIMDIRRKEDEKNPEQAKWRKQVEEEDKEEVE
jgi:hypothetical protein